MQRLLWLFLLILPCAFANRLIIEPEMGRAPIINALEHSKQSVQLVMYGFTDQTIRDALLATHAKGRTVQLILEAKPYRAETENNNTIALLKQNAIAWHGSVAPFRLIHQKTLLIDNREAWVMTFNFTQSTFKQQRNFALVLDDARTVHEIGRLFSADWNQKPYALPSEWQNTLILSPNNSRKALTQLIEQAKQSIDIYAQTLNDYQIIGSLAKAAQRGVSIRLLTTGKLRDKQTAYLSRAGMTIQYDTKLMIHAKVLIIDGQKAVLGSTNLTRSSLNDNRELSIVTQDPAIVGPLKKTFQQDFAQETPPILKERKTTPPANALTVCEPKLSISLKSFGNCLANQALKYILSTTSAQIDQN